MKTSKPTMADVAKHAGVSAATVARVIYQNGYVKEGTRAAVEAAVKLTGYSPSLMARGLRTSRSFTLGMVVSDAYLNTFPPAVAQVIQQEALKHGYTVLTLNNRSADLEAAGVRRFLDHHVDAVIFCTAIDPDNVRFIQERGTPTVQIERVAAQTGSFVTVDAEAGIREAVDHLYRLGHRSFAYFGGDEPVRRTEGSPENTVEYMRERHFMDCLLAHGIGVTDKRIRRASYYVEGKPDHQPGFYLVNDLLEMEPRPTALICGSDLLAAAAIQGLKAKGLEVPRDISVIGFDDTLAEVLTPPLSSIAQPVDELGRLAVSFALAAIDDPTLSPQTTKVATKLVIRESTGPTGQNVMPSVTDTVPGKSAR